uniref:Uncharacterized protein n=1 Tax=Prymnesium polylepis TaxID=72548 RepID=A0A7S4M280_9EUKA
MIIEENIRNERRIRKDWELRQRTERVEDEARWQAHSTARIADEQRRVEQSKTAGPRQRADIAEWAAARDAKEFKPKGQRDWEAKVAERARVAAAREDAVVLGRVKSDAVKADPALAGALATLRSRVDHLEKTKVVFDPRKSAV